MKTLRNVAAILCAVFMLSACGSSSPESVAESYLKAFLEIDATKAAKYATEEFGARLLDEVTGHPEDILKELIKERKEELKGIKYKVTNVDVEEEDAYVTFELSKGDKTENGTIDLVKENGKWKVDYQWLNLDF